MALVKCRECEKEISDMADSCVSCGCPVISSKAGGAAQPIKTQTVEGTGKIWKALQLAGVVITLIGIVACMAAMQTSGSDPVVSSIVGFGGLGLYIFGRIGAWWYHK